MSIMMHLNYTYGAFIGAFGGSFLVHFGDTLAARAFSNVQKQNMWSTAKIMIKSYVPIGIGVVPMRALSFGVYSVAQQFFYHWDSFEGKIIGGILSGLSLVVLSAPAEILKTRKQLELDTSLPWYKTLSLHEIRSNLVPLCFRVVPTVTCMLTGTEYIRLHLNIDDLVISTTIASFLAATLSQNLATPFENLRIHRIQKKNYSSSTISLIKELSLSRIYKGFWYRGLSLGLQAAITLTAASMATRYIT